MRPFSPAVAAAAARRVIKIIRRRHGERLTFISLHLRYIYTDVAYFAAHELYESAEGEYSCELSDSFIII